MSPRYLPAPTADPATRPLLTRRGRQTGTSPWNRMLATAALAAVALAWMVPASAQTVGSDSGGGELSVGAAVVLGLVEGFTEYLPVSSTGHLLVTNEILGLGGTEEADQSLDAYAICIQAGAILAVLVLYHRRLHQMLDGLLGRSAEGRAVLLAVIAAFVPTAAIGYALRGVVRDELFGTSPIAAAWLVGGVGILVLERRGFLQRGGAALHEITVRQALLIGLIQTIALWPGVSRSLVTIVGAVLVGLSLAAAVEFSFLLGLITLSAATALTAFTDGELLVETFGVITPIVGLVVAFVSAVASIRWMVTFLQQRGLSVFGWYRVAIGILAFGAIALGWL